MERGAYPMFISEVERSYLGLDKATMNEMGYAWDEESQQWILGERIDEGPQVAGAASRYGYPGGFGGPGWGW